MVLENLIKLGLLRLQDQILTIKHAKENI